MSDKTTLSDGQLQDLIQDVNDLHDAFNKIGRGHVSECDWVFAYMEGRLPKLVKRIKEQKVWQL